MAELKNDEEEHSLPAKRKSDLTAVPKDIDNEAKEEASKKQKLNSEEENTEVDDDKKDENDDDEEEEVEEYEGDDGVDTDDEEEEVSEDEEHSNGEAQIDRKGKGIMRDDKGKGKLIEESDDSSEDASDSEADSDLSEDPLAEVDLDNILPSRTRRRVVHPGLYIKNDQPKDNAADDSDDSDA